MANGGNRLADAGAALQDQHRIGGKPTRDVGQNRLSRVIARGKGGGRPTAPLLPPTATAAVRRHQMLRDRGEKSIRGGGRHRYMRPLVE